MNPLFHMSLPCKNLEETVKFYQEKLGCKIGRQTNNWADINLFENQLTFIKSEKFDFQYPFYNLEKNQLPSFHFGVILNTEDWNAIYNKVNTTTLETVAKKTFFENKNGEQHCFFIQDPNNYFIEFKTFKKNTEVFT